MLMLKKKKKLPTNNNFIGKAYAYDVFEFRTILAVLILHVDSFL